MSCGQIALERAGIKVSKYFAAEIKEIGIKVTKYNYPNTIHIGDVNKVRFKDGILYTENGNFEVGHFDLVMFGSPCQTFSIAIKATLRIGLDNPEKSGLFFQCLRILKEVNPTYFLMENVRSMRDEDKNVISEYLGCEPMQIDSKLVGPALRNRYYWTNIPVVKELNNKGVCLQSVLENGWTDREKARCLAVIDSRPNTTPIKMFHRYCSTGFTTLIFKDEKHYVECVKEYEKLAGGKRKIKATELDEYTGHVFDGVRYMNQVELERCQTVPEGYTKCLTRNEAADVLGDGWTVDVIAHILSYLKEQTEKENDMELKVREITIPEKILFNYEELKQEIQEKVQQYTNLVYTGEQIKDAKTDRSNLNKLKKALNDERIRLEREYLQPFNDFKEKINEIIKIIDEPVKLIDKQIKEAEEQEKAEKRQKIEEYWNSKDKPFEIPFEKVLDDRWLNKSTSMASVTGAIDVFLECTEKDLATLSNLPEFGFEAKEVYKSTLDINRALNEGKRLAEIQKRKEEEYRRAEEARKAAEAKKDDEQLPGQIGFADAKSFEECMNPSETEMGQCIEGIERQAFEECVARERQWVSFKANLTTDDALALKAFFESRNIEFRPL